MSALIIAGATRETEEVADRPRRTARRRITRSATSPSTATLPVRTLLYAMLLPSANDAANELAVHVAGSIPAFVAQMNARAQR